MLNRGHIWLRVCAFAHGKEGHENMEYVAAATNCFVYAHTYNIGDWAAQSGLVRLAPGADAKWSLEEGCHPKTKKIMSSSWIAPRTKFAFDMKIPKDFTFG